MCLWSGIQMCFSKFSRYYSIFQCLMLKLFLPLISSYFFPLIIFAVGAPSHKLELQFDKTFFPSFIVKPETVHNTRLVVEGTSKQNTIFLLYFDCKLFSYISNYSGKATKRARFLLCRLLLLFMFLCSSFVQSNPSILIWWLNQKNPSPTFCWKCIENLIQLK